MPQELSDSIHSPDTKPQRFVDLTQCRIHRLERSIMQVRIRLENSELKRFRAEIELGRLIRELAHHRHELKILKARLGRISQR